MSKTALVMAALVLTGTSLVLAQRVEVGRTDSPEVLLKAAVNLELVDGQSSVAIQRYREIATRYKTTNRRVAAQALLHAARSYEKVASPEARVVYAELLRDFADQPEATEARAQLAMTGAGKRLQDSMNPVRVIADDSAPIDRVSLDGRLALIVSNETPSRLLVRDLTTNLTRTLVVGSESALAIAPVFSPDARQVAYVWREKGAPVASLKVTGTESGAQPRTLLPPSSEMRLPLGWSADGQSLLVFAASAHTALTAVSMADGSTRTIRSFEAWRGVNQGVFTELPRLSPDGQFVAFSAVAREGSKERHIYVVDVHGRNETDVVKIAGSNTQPVWTHDGLVFINEQSGQRDLFSVPVRDGQATGEPVRVKPGFVGDLLSVSVSGDVLQRAPQLRRVRRVDRREESGWSARRPDIQGNERLVVKREQAGVRQGWIAG